MVLIYQAILSQDQVTCTSVIQHFPFIEAQDLKTPDFCSISPVVPDLPFPFCEYSKDSE